MKSEKDKRSPWDTANELAHGAFDEAWFTKAIARSIIAAVDRERGRCAKIVSKTAEAWEVTIDPEMSVRESVAQSLREVESKIRGDDKKGSSG